MERAFVLAGGLGTRLQSVVADRPKPLAEILGRPFLHYLLQQLVIANVQETVLCTGHQAAMVQEILGNAWKGMRLLYSPEPQPLGTGGAVRLAWERFGCAAGLVLNGDSYCEADLADFLHQSRASSKDVAMLVLKKEDCRRYGSVELDEQQRVKRFVEKSATAGAGWINGGIYRITDSFIHSFESGQNFSLERDAFPRWIDQGIHAVTHQGRFIDIGTPESYKEAETFFASIRID